MPIMDDVKELMKLNDDELTEKLLEPKYGKALLREQLRRTLVMAEHYKDLWENEKKEKESLRKEIPIREILLTVNRTAEELNVDSLEVLEMVQKKL
ncbi:hypothetical protein MZM54_03115 [[Brevibacterium] frigoritolerans]|nr:hypothetical protein [Peribacillus frigoritolerans]